MGAEKKISRRGIIFSRGARGGAQRINDLAQGTRRFAEE